MRNIEFSIGEYYHLYARGTDKRKTFMNIADYKRFQLLLYLCNSEDSIEMYKLLRNKKSLDLFSKTDKKGLVSIGAYCLMPNHFHILVKEIQENGISIFMHKLLTAYTMYFNNKYTRTGSLFSSTYKAIHANEDRYLKYLFSYIHLNPIKIIDSTWKEQGVQNVSQTKDFLNRYYFSSYIDYCNEERREKIILAKNDFPEYFKDQKALRESIYDWITLGEA